MCICTQGGGVHGLTGRDVPRPVGRGSFLGTVPVQITFVADTLERPVLVTELHALSVRWWLRKRRTYILFFFSSPEMKAQVSFSDRLSSACPSVYFYIFIFFFRSTWSISTKHGTKHHWVKGFKFIQMKGNALFRGDIITKKREYINEIWKIFFTRTTRPISTNFGTLGTKHPWVKEIKFVQIKEHICTLFHSEIITKYQKYILQSLEIFFSGTIWPISTKLGIKHTWMKKTQGFAKKTFHLS